MSETPFVGKKLTPRERREAEQRSRQRAAERARAAQEARVSAALLGQQGDGLRFGVGADPASPWHSGPAFLQDQPLTNPFQPGWVSAAPSVADAPTPADRPAARRPWSKVADLLEGAAQRCTASVRGQWGPAASRVAVLVGLVVVLAGLVVGLAVGGPFLGHDGRPVVAVAGVAGVGAGALWVSKGWAGAGSKLRLSAAGIALVVGVCFSVGTLSSPVLLDGKVYLSTSKEARSYALIQQMRTDLLMLADADRYLTYDAAEAGAHYEEYAVVTAQLEALSSQYSLLDDASRVPDEAFLPVVEQTKSAAWWAYQAVTAKTATLTESDSGLEADLTADRAAYAEAVVSAGSQLKDLAATLGLPLSVMGPTE